MRDKQLKQPKEGWENLFKRQGPNKMVRCPAPRQGLAIENAEGLFKNRIL